MVGAAAEVGAEAGVSRACEQGVWGQRVVRGWECGGCVGGACDRDKAW